MHHGSPFRQALQCVIRTTVLGLMSTVGRREAPVTKKTHTSETFVANLKMLMAETGLKSKDVAARSGVSLRMVQYILSGERKPTVDVAEDIGSAFGLTGWQMIVPSLRTDLARSGKLSRLVSNYMKSSQSGQDYISQVAEREAGYENGK